VPTFFYSLYRIYAAACLNCHGKHDTGIDLVAKKKDYDEYCAIQCKFYDENYPVSKADVDTFLSASGKPFFIDGKPMRYTERIIVPTTDKWSSTVEDTIEGQLLPVTRIRLKDLKDSGIDWDSFSLSDINEMKRDGRKHEYPHQTKAIEAVLSGFQSADRGKLIMACGTGKTFTSLKIAEVLTNGTGNVLFLVPSISLLNQTLLEWPAQCKYDYSVFAICSDPKASAASDEGGRTPVSITIRVKKKGIKKDGYVRCYDIGDYLTREQKLSIIAEFGSIKTIPWKIL